MSKGEFIKEIQKIQNISHKQIETKLKRDIRASAMLGFTHLRFQTSGKIMEWEVISILGDGFSVRESDSCSRSCFEISWEKE